MIKHATEDLKLTRLLVTHCRIAGIIARRRVGAPADHIIARGVIQRGTRIEIVGARIVATGQRWRCARAIVRVGRGHKVGGC